MAEYKSKYFGEDVDAAIAVVSSIYVKRPTGNLFNKNAPDNQTGKFMRDGGEIIDLAGYVLSYPIPVEKGKRYYISANTNVVPITSSTHFFNGSGQWTTRLAETTSATRVYAEVVGNYITFEIPESFDVAYMYLNMQSNKVETFMVSQRNSPPSAYEDYGEKEVLSPAFSAGVKNAINPLYGKNIAYNGDSICESRLDQSETRYNGGAYAKIIADLTGGTYENRAVGGGILASAVPEGQTSPTHFVVSDISNMSEYADLVCLEGGINDYWTNVPLGDYAEDDYAGELDTATLCGALESIFRQALEKWVGKPICFVIAHKISNTAHQANRAGYTFKQAHDKMVGICKKYSIPYYDAFESSGLNGWNTAQNNAFLNANSTGTPDGCHPNEAGYKAYYVPQLINLFESIMPLE